jgi:hypothetical protein
MVKTLRIARENDDLHERQVLKRRNPTNEMVRVPNRGPTRRRVCPDLVIHGWAIGR